MEFSIAASILFSIFDLKRLTAGLMRYVTGMFFPKTVIVGLSTQSNDFNVVLELNLQLFKLTLLNKVTTPFRLNSCVLYKSTPMVFVPILYLAQIFKGKTVL